MVSFLLRNLVLGGSAFSFRCRLNLKNISSAHVYSSQSKKWGSSQTFNLSTPAQLSPAESERKSCTFQEIYKSIEQSFTEKREAPKMKLINDLCNNATHLKDLDLIEHALSQYRRHARRIRGGTINDLGVAYIRLGAPDRFLKLIGNQNLILISPSRHALHLLIHSFSKRIVNNAQSTAQIQEDINNILCVFGLFKNFGYVPTGFTYDLMIEAFTHANVENASKLIEIFSAQALEEAKSNSSFVLHPIFYNRLMQFFLSKKEPEKALAFFSIMPKKSLWSHLLASEANSQQNTLEASVQHFTEAVKLAENNGFFSNQNPWKSKMTNSSAEHWSDGTKRGQLFQNLSKTLALMVQDSSVTEIEKARYLESVNIARYLNTV